jgi:hypothetical protein
MARLAGSYNMLFRRFVAVICYMGHVLTDNWHGLVVNVSDPLAPLL